MGKEIKVQIDWEDDDQAGGFVNHLLASYDGAVYTLRFYQVLPPALLAIDPPAEQKVESVKGRHITTMVVTHDTLSKLVGVMQDLMARNTSSDTE